VEQGFRRVEERIRVYEERFSRFLPASEVSRLNHSSRTWLEISPELFEMLALAQRLHAETGGLFDPSVLPALERAGYDRSMDEIRAAGGQAASGPACALPCAGFSGLHLDAALRAAQLEEGVRIDLGGLAKGWIVEQAAHLLGSYAQASLVDAGGDLFMIGLPEDQPFWPVALEDPFDPERQLALLRVGPGAVVTSSIARRAWTQNGMARHHLIDPRSGQPAAAEWVSVTVVYRHTAPAEALAKALLIGGPAQAESLLANRPGAEYIAVDHAGGLWGSAGSHDLLANEQSFDAIMERLL
jgi:FAD:protein FMN transferase